MNNQTIRSHLEATQQTVRFFETLLNSSTDGIIITDASQNIILVNEAFSSYLGKQPHLIVETSIFDWLDLFDADAPNLWVEIGRQVQFRGFIHGKEFQLTRHGKTSHFDVNASRPIRNDKEEEGVIISVWHDITERKKAEEALRKAHDELEMRVEERTEELKFLSTKLLEAHEAESKRIGQELHDGLAQTLSAIKVWVETARMQTDRKNPDEAAKSFENIIPLTKEAVEEVRRISKRLRPTILEDLGIVPTISWLCKDFMTIYPGIDIEEQIGIEENDVPESLKIVIFRVLQEALNNIAKHSQANLVRVSLNQDENALALTINDNGVGFDSEQISNGEQFMKGLGLASMKERTTLSGGSFLIESQKGEGTRIQASWV